MAHEVGRSIPLSPFRRLVIDLMQVSQKVPAVTVERRHEPGGPGGGPAALHAPAELGGHLRQVSTPWSPGRIPPPFLPDVPLGTALRAPVLHSLPERRAADARRSGRNQCLIRRPDDRSLAELDGIMRAFQAEPLEQMGAVSAGDRAQHIFWPIRPLVWRGANVSG